MRRSVTGGHVGEVVEENGFFAGHEIGFDGGELGLLRLSGSLHAVELGPARQQRPANECRRQYSHQFSLRK